MSLFELTNRYVIAGLTLESDGLLSWQQCREVVCAAELRRDPHHF
jgi:hypothetical protein